MKTTPEQVETALQTLGSGGLDELADAVAQALCRSHVYFAGDLPGFMSNQTMPYHTKHLIDFLKRLLLMPERVRRSIIWTVCDQKDPGIASVLQELSVSPQ